MKTNFKSINHVCIGLAMAFLAILFGCTKTELIVPQDVKSSSPNSLKAAANSLSNANAAYDGYLNAFLVRSGGQTYLTDGINKRDRAFMWGQAYMITALEDAYDRNPNATRKQLISDILNSFIQGNGSDWSWDSWNDDIAWACIVFSRGYQITGNATFLNAAKWNWDMCWNRGWDNVDGGGIWENQDKWTKCALSNDPMVIAGCFIYQSTNDVGYLNKCRQMYAWVKGNLWDQTTGQVNEALTNTGAKQYSDREYNRGGLINAAASLYRVTGEIGYFNEAKLAADQAIAKYPFVMNENNPNNGGFGADQVVRGIAKLARENNLWGLYQPWLVRQCIAVWNNRRTDYNITNNDWRNPTPGGETWGMESMSALTVLSVTPESQAVEIPNGTYKVISRTNGYALDAVGMGTGNNTALDVWPYNGGSNQKWVLTSLGSGLYKLIGQGSGRSINDPGNSGDNGTALILWDDQGTGNEKIYFTSPANGYYTMFFVNSGLAVDVNGSNQSVIQWQSNGGNNQQWQFMTP